MLQQINITIDVDPSYCVVNTSGSRCVACKKKISGLSQMSSNTPLEFDNIIFCKQCAYNDVNISFYNNQCKYDMCLTSNTTLSVLFTLDVILFKMISKKNVYNYKTGELLSKNHMLCNGDEFLLLDNYYNHVVNKRMFRKWNHTFKDDIKIPINDNMNDKIYDDKILISIKDKSKYKTLESYVLGEFEFTKDIITLIGKFTRTLLIYDKIPTLKLSEIVFGQDNKLQIFPTTYISTLRPSKAVVIGFITQLKSENNRIKVNTAFSNYIIKLKKTDIIKKRKKFINNISNEIRKKQNELSELNGTVVLENYKQINKNF